MAIVQMKKLQLMVVREQKEALLRDLMLLGCVSVTEPDLPQEGDAAQLRPESGGLTEARADQAKLTAALGLLDKYAPVKSKLLSARPEVSEAEFLDENAYRRELEAASQMEDLEAQIRRLTSEETRLRSSMEALGPWTGLDLPLETKGTGSTDVILGTIPAVMDLTEAKRALAEAAPEAELFPVNADKDAHYTVLVCHKSVQAEALQALRAFGFAIASVAGTVGTAREQIEAQKKQVAAIGESRAALERQIAAYSTHRDAIKLSIDRANVFIGKAEAAERMVGTDSVVCLNGWMEAPEEARVVDTLSKYDCSWEFTEPTEEEYAAVPVKLKNAAVTEPLNMVTNMYSLPAYGSLDPNPLMAPFFILFYGIMMADMGYGLLMIAAALIVKHFVKPKRGSKTFVNLLLEGGISTFIFGVLTGGFFGDLIPTLYKMFKGVEMGDNFLTKPLINPLNDTQTILYGALVLGVLQLCTGMIISMTAKIKKGDTKSAIFEEGSWFVILAGLLMFVFKIGNVAGIPVVLIIGVLMLIYGAAYPAKGFGKVTAVFAAIYNGVTGWLGDILSYSRLMALMLAGSVVAQVFNNLATMPMGSNKPNVLTFLLFVLICLVGHALNFALNLLGCFVHDLRLQCLEYFGKFYQDGGKPFKPLEINTKYVDVENHL
ncbi:MAG: V-type ATP synthase subunit I [Eggerthellaceae bacterium]|nr:V-type ATP synthase subunit I [Eggerthellaceae bacterium]